MAKILNLGKVVGSDAKINGQTAITLTGANGVSVITSGTDVTVDGAGIKTELTTHTSNTDIHVTAEEKAAWNGKADLSDIPTTLPANGGNADIAKYIGTWGSPEQYYGEQLKMRVLYNKFGDYRFGLTTDTDNEIRVDYATNADTLDGKHAAEFAPYHSYAPIYIGDILDITEMGTYSCSVSDCTNLPPEIVSWCYITMHQFRDTGYKHYICMPLNNFSEILNTIWISSEANKDSSGKLIWSRACDGGNADTIDGKHASDFVRRYDALLTTDYVSNAAMDMDYKGVVDSDTANSIGLDGSNSCWWHIIGLRNTNNDGYGTQIAIPLYPSNSNQIPKYRTSAGTTFQNWSNVADGGNADTVDGKHASDFATPIYKGYPERGDCNNATAQGVYTVSNNSTNAPGSGFYMLTVDVAGGGDWIVQTAFWISLKSEAYRRINVNGAWGEWYNIADDGNAHSVQGYSPKDNGTKGLPAITSDYGPIEIGKYLDFHTSDGQDYKVRITANDDGSLSISSSSTTDSICLRNLSSGTAAANTTNCPSGAWYGQYEEV